MKRLLLILTLICLSGCGASNPEFTAFGSYDDNPVTGQRILISVSGITDNPNGIFPIWYAWNSTGGTFEDANIAQSWVYWTAPDTAGRYTVTCMMRDKNGDSDPLTFTFDVQERKLIQLYEASSTQTPVIDNKYTKTSNFINSIASQPNTKSGGIFAGRTTLIENKEVTPDPGDDDTVLDSSDTSNTQYHQSTFWANVGFGRNYLALTGSIQTTYFTPLYSIFGAFLDSGKLKISSYVNKAETVTECEASVAGINEIAKDGGALWVAADSGVHYLSGTAWSSAPRTGDNSLIGNTKSYDIINIDGLINIANTGTITKNLTYIANTAGLYSYNKKNGWFEHQFAGDITALAVTVDRNYTHTVYSVSATSGSVQINGLDKGAPAPLTNDIAIDLQNRIWNGSFYSENDGADWSAVPDPENLLGGKTIDKTVVSPEGLVYMKTTDGDLFVWGKQD